MTFPAGTTSQTFNVAVTGDTTPESNETVAVTLSNPTNATISSATGTGTITNDDAGVVITPTALTVTEEGPGKSFTVALATNPGDGVEIAVRFQADEGLAMSSPVPFRNNRDVYLEFEYGGEPFPITVTALADSNSQDEIRNIRYDVFGGYGPSGSRNVAVTVIDDDKPAVSLSLSPASVSENAGVSTVTATLDKVSTAATTITVSAAAGAGTDASDFTLSSANTLTIPAGSTTSTGTVTVTAVDNALDEPDKRVTVSGSASNSVGVEQPADQTLTITDDDGPTLSLDSPSVTEGDSGSTNLTFTATLSAASVQQVTVAYADAGSGTATSGTDYTAITGGTLTFPVGTTSQTFDVAVTGDTTDEVDETVVVTLSSPTNATIATGTGTGTITDDDGPTVSINSPSVTEGDSGSTTLTFTVTLSAASVQQVTVAYADATTGTATSGTDYTAITGGTLTFPAGTTSQTFNVAVTGDTTDEANKTVVVSLSSPTNATIATATGTGTITDDDGPTVSIDSPSVTEGDSGSTTLTFTVTLSAASVQPVTVDYADAETGTATSGTDYTAIIGGTLTFPAGTISQTFNVAVTGDTTDEANETVMVALVNPTNATIATATGTGTITNDDGVTLLINAPSVTEGNSGSTTLTFTVTLGAASSQQVTVDYADAGTGTATSGTDYTTITAGTLTFTAGTTSQTFNVAVTGDTLGEANETVVVTLSNPTNATIATGTGTGTITNDDAGVVITPTALTVTEEGPGKSFTVALATNPGDGVEIAVRFQADEGLAMSSPVPFRNNRDVYLEFEYGGEPFPITVTALADSNSQDEIRNIRYDVFGGYGPSGSRNVAVTVIDDDKPAVSLSLSPASVSENAGVSTVTATLSEAVAVATTITVSAAAGTGADSSDFTLSSANTLTIAAGETTSTGTVTVTAVDNALDEPDKRVTVSGAVSHDGVAAPADEALTITDDDPAPTLSLDSPSVTEGDSGSTTLTFTATLSAASSRHVTVAWADAATGTATSGTDYTAITGGTLIFAAGTTSRTFTVAVTGDTLDEANETVVVSLSNPTNAAISSTTGTGTGTITDDDAATATLSINSPSVAEGNSGSTNLTFTVTLSAASGQSVTVAYADAGTGTATSGTDYTAITGGTLTFTAGTTSQTFNVAVTGDTLIESNETVVVTLSSPMNATVSATAGTGTGTITNDDAGLIFNPAALTVTEEGPSKSFTVSLATDPGFEVSIDIYPPAGLRVNNRNTNRIGVDISFGDGLPISVTALADSNSEDETRYIQYNAFGYGPTGRRNGVAVTVIDNDKPAVSLLLSPASVSENGGVATVTATLSEASTAATTITVSAAAGTDTDSSDFTLSAATTLTIAAGATTSTGTVTVTAVDNALDELDKRVIVSGTASNSSAVGVLQPADQTLTITDDDGPTVSIDSPSVTEGDSGSTTLTFTATLSAASVQQVTVAYADATTGTATSGTDYTAITGGTLTFPAGTTSQTFDVAVTGDTTDEVDETVVVTLSSPTNATIATATGTGTITDDDGPTVSIDSPSVTEGDSGSTNLTFTATLSAASVQPVTVAYADATTGTATAGTDYTAITGGTLTFTAGTTSQTFNVAVTGDTTDELNETVVVTLSSPTNATVSATAGNGTGTITDDDGPTVSIDSPSVTEGDSGSTNLTFTVTLSALSVQQVTVAYADATTGTATSGTDYTAITGGTLTFAVGTTSQTFNVSVLGDTLDEANETVVVTLSSPTNATIATASGTGTITNDDGATLSINSPSVTEGNSGSTNLTFTVTLSAASGQSVTVAYADAGTGTATSGTDYTAITVGTLTFAAGTTSQTFNVAVTGDTTFEANETVVVTLSGATNATIAAGTGTGTITNDDAGLIFTPTALTLTEEGASKSFTIQLATDPGFDVSFDIFPPAGLRVDNSTDTIAYDLSYGDTLALSVEALADSNSEDETKYIQYSAFSYGPSGRRNGVEVLNSQTKCNTLLRCCHGNPLSPPHP